MTGKSLKILAVHRYYWPDSPPYGAILRQIVRRCHQDSHEIEVLSSQPSYNSVMFNQRRPKYDVIDGVLVRRMLLPYEKTRPLIRIINSIRLCCAVILKAVTKHYDVIMISTIPPVLGGVAAAIAAKMTKSRFIYHCMDIHPEIGQISGEFSNPLFFKFLYYLDTWSCRQANPVVVLSRDMENTLRKRPGGDEFRIKVLNNFSLPSEKEIPNDLPFHVFKKKLIVLFAGNIGRFQGLDNVVEAMATLKGQDDIEFILMGEGDAKTYLQKKAEFYGVNIKFVGHHPIEIAKATMKLVDFGFVSLIPGLYKYVYPSKTMTYLEQGCPLIVAVEPESELARDIKKHKYGYCVSVGDSQALAKLLVWIRYNRTRYAEMKMNALKKAKETFSQEVVLREWSKILDKKQG